MLMIKHFWDARENCLLYRLNDILSLIVRLKVGRPIKTNVIYFKKDTNLDVIYKCLATKCGGRCDTYPNQTTN